MQVEIALNHKHVIIHVWDPKRFRSVSATTSPGPWSRSARLLTGRSVAMLIAEDTPFFKVRHLSVTRRTGGVGMWAFQGTCKVSGNREGGDRELKWSFRKLTGNRQGRCRKFKWVEIQMGVSRNSDTHSLRKPIFPRNSDTQTSEFSETRNSVTSNAFRVFGCCQNPVSRNTMQSSGSKKQYI